MTEKRFKNSLNKWNLNNHITNAEKACLNKKRKPDIIYIFNKKDYNQFKEMDDLQHKAWYACYGSNLLEERFLCYILGGQPAGAKTVYGGCLDKTIPSESEDMYINSELYFARASKNWDNGGVAFIRTTFSPTIKTMGRIYLITKGQLMI